MHFKYNCHKERNVFVTNTLKLWTGFFREREEGIILIISTEGLFNVKDTYVIPTSQLLRHLLGGHEIEN